MTLPWIAPGIDRTEGDTMKATWMGCLALALLHIGCAPRAIVDPSENAPSLKRLNKVASRHIGIIEFRDGTLEKARSINVRSDLTYFVDVKTGTAHHVPSARIREIRFRGVGRWRRALAGLGIGFAAGVASGALLDDGGGTYGFLFLAGIGETAGVVVGALVGHVAHFTFAAPDHWPPPPPSADPDAPH
jgi:hypothetical protein